MDEDVKQTLTAMEGRMGAMEGRILGRIHDSETRLLSAFYGWGKPIESRLRLLPTLDERVPELQGTFLYEVIRIDHGRCRVRLTLLEKTTGKTGNVFAPWTMHKIGDTFASAYPPPTRWRAR